MGINIYPYLCIVKQIKLCPPIHVHVERDDDEAKIAIEPEVKVVYNHGLKPQDLKRALKLIKMYKAEIIETWNQYHD